MTKTFYLFLTSIFVFFVSICLFIYGLFDHGNRMMIDFDIQKEEEMTEEPTLPPTEPPQMVAVQCPPGVILFTICSALFFVLILSFFAMDYTKSPQQSDSNEAGQQGGVMFDHRVRSTHDKIYDFFKYIANYFPFIVIALIVILSIIISQKNTLHTASIIFLVATILIMYNSILQEEI